MAIEQLLQTLIASLDANTAALVAAGGGKSADKETTTEKAAAKTTTTKKPAKPAEDAITQEVMKAALNKVKEDLGSEEAKKIIKSHGKADKLAEIEEEKYAAVVAQCEKVLKAAEDSSASGDDDGL